MKAFLFEVKKIVRDRTFVFFLLITLLFVSGLFIRNLIQQDSIPLRKIETFSDYANEVSFELYSDRNDLEKNPDPELEAKIEVGSELYYKLNELIDTIRSNDWKKELEMEISTYEIAMEYLNMKGNISLYPSEMKTTIKLNEELLKRELPKEDLNLSIQTSVFIKQIISLFFNTFGFLIILLMFGILITKEFEEKSIKIVYSLPISRAKYILIKFISLLNASLIWVITVLLLAYTLPSIFGKNSGDIYNYPLFMETGNFVSTGDFIKESIFLIIAFIAFAIALLVFSSFLVRNTIVNYIILIFLFLGSFILIKNGFSSIKNPFTYQAIELTILSDSAHSVYGLYVLFGTMFILLIATIFINKRRGIK